MPSGHGNWTVSNDGCGGADAPFLLVASVVVVALAAAVLAVVAFVVAHAVVLAWGLAGIGVVLTVGTWLVHRYLTVCYWAAAVPSRPPPPPITTVFVHRHVIEYAPAPAAIENQRQVVQAAVIAAALETQEVPK
jgi:hypothetical protein